MKPGQEHLKEDVIVEWILARQNTTVAKTVWKVVFAGHKVVEQHALENSR